MAWTAGGNGSSVEIGGTLTPETVLPWEVKTGSNVTGLDAKIKKGQSEVDIVANKAIPVLGIRTIESTFQGQPGISPSRQPGGCGLSWPEITVIKTDNIIVFQVVICPVQLNPVNENLPLKEANFPAMS
ncbi:TPA: hypothetical protein ACGBQD_004209 [Escherichia coli]